MNRPQVVQSPIFNDCLIMNIDGHTEPQIFPKLLLEVSVQEPHNSLVGDSVDGVLKESIYAENNIFISDYTLSSLLPPQFKIYISRYKVMYGCECFIYAKSIHSLLLS